MSKRITVTHDDDLDPVSAMLAAGYAIAYWSKESSEGRYWAPGSIAVYKSPDLGDTAIATSTRKTRAGWSVVLYLTTEPQNANIPTP